jgi:hypothetical protein
VTTPSLRPGRPIEAFLRLDSDWAHLCHQHRRTRSAVPARWAEREPALQGVRDLADVIPPPGRDRSPIFNALVSLTATGEDLAGRALLQLLVPGLVRLVHQTPHRSGPEVVAVDLIEATWRQIAAIAKGSPTFRRPDIMLRSSRRTLLARRAADRREVTGLHPGIDDHHRADRDDAGQPSGGLRRRLSVVSACCSAETKVLTSTGYARQALETAASACGLTSIEVELVWRTAVDHDTVTDVAAQAGTSRAQAYHRRSRAHLLLRDQLARTA